MKDRNFFLQGMGKKGIIILSTRKKTKTRGGMQSPRKGEAIHGREN